MLREATINLYLVFFRLVFQFFKLFPHQKKTYFMTYFGYNVLHTVEAIERKRNERIVIVKTKHCRVFFQEKENRTIIQLSKWNLLNWFHSVYHLATSDRIIVDNYEGFLAVTDFKPGTKCVQLWHAAGAVKKFGLEDMSVKKRSKSAIERFKKVYNRFDHVVVGSEKMTDIFCQSFGIGEERILRTGIPRTDFFYNEEKKKEAMEKLYREYPLIKDKKVILYAPTFRDNERSVKESPINIEKLYEAFKDEYLFIFKTHPIVKNHIDNKYKEFVIDMSHYENINHLLLVTDILISDYSSVPFEFALLEKPMIFYAYDLEEYTRERGIWEEYNDMVCGPIARNTEEIIQAIKKNDFDESEIKRFKEVWNRYSDGNSSDNLVNELYKR